VPRIDSHEIVEPLGRVGGARHRDVVRRQRRPAVRRRFLQRRDRLIRVRVVAHDGARPGRDRSRLRCVSGSQKIASASGFMPTLMAAPSTSAMIEIALAPEARK
jgi:hypothetical protein